MEEIGGRTIFDYGGNIWCLVQCKIIPNDYPFIITSAVNRIVFNASQYCPHEIAESELVAGLLGDDDPLSRPVDASINSARQNIVTPFYGKDDIDFLLTQCVVSRMANPACSMATPVFFGYGANVETRLIDIDQGLNRYVNNDKRWWKGDEPFQPLDRVF